MAGPLVQAIRRELKRQADPAKAPAMQAYMKSAMPYLGVMSTPQRRIHAEIIPRYPLAAFEEWRDAVLLLWRDARYREERYAAIALAGHRVYESFRTMRVLPVYEEIIVTGAWWDYVDSVAAQGLGGLLRRYPPTMKKRMVAWNRSRDLWKRRASILCQLRFKGETDLDLLYRLVLGTMHEKEFFIQKAIGWALREYAWSDPGAVRRFVKLHENGLSSLSKREALKNMCRGGALA